MTDAARADVPFAPRVIEVDIQEEPALAIDPLDNLRTAGPGDFCRTVGAVIRHHQRASTRGERRHERLKCTAQNESFIVGGNQHGDRWNFI